MRLTFDHETFTNHSYVTFCTISILQQCVKILINYLLCFTDFFSSSNVCYLECLIDRGRGPVRSAAACSLPVHEEECDSGGGNGYKYQHAKSHIPVVDCPNVLIFLIVQVVENVFVLPNVFLKYVMQSVVCLLGAPSRVLITLSMAGWTAGTGSNFRRSVLNPLGSTDRHLVEQDCSPPPPQAERVAPLVCTGIACSLS